MKIDLFDVEAWMTEHEVDYRYNLAETCVASMSINDLLEMVEEKETVIKNLFDTKLNYGPITGTTLRPANEVTLDKLLVEIPKSYKSLTDTSS